MAVDPAQSFRGVADRAVLAADPVAVIGAREQVEDGVERQTVVRFTAVRHARDLQVAGEGQHRR